MLKPRPIRYICLVLVLYFLFNSLYVWRKNNVLLSPKVKGARGVIGLNHYVKSTEDWGKFKPHHKVTTPMVHLPRDEPKTLPRIQYDFRAQEKGAGSQSESRRLAVRRAFQKCWRSYRKYGWTMDELTPITGKGKDTFGGWGATLFDALDTLWIMDLKAEFKEAVEAVARVDWSKTEGTSANVFETTIRYLGGLLSAYDLSGEQVLILKAIELGDMLLASFDRPNHLPGFWLDYEKTKKGEVGDESNIPLASPGSLSMEFTRLSQITNDDKYYDAIDRITNVLAKHQNSTKLPGMWPNSIDLQQFDFTKQTEYSIGALADSAYEYLPKMHALMGGTNPIYLAMTKFSFKTIYNHILYRPSLPGNEDILFASTVYASSQEAKKSYNMEHLSCFAGGMFALGGRLLEMENYVRVGKKLADGCIWAYHAFPAGIMPEDFRVNTACPSFETCKWTEPSPSNPGNPSGVKGITVGSHDYLLRPEAIESAFVLYRITGDRKYQDDAWKMFNAIMNATSTEYGNAAITYVDLIDQIEQKDSMESFWMAETLKYFFLIFSSPDLISLDDYVFNTEAHPFRRMGTSATR